MIKFFRKIRQNLLSEGKTGKYLKYAFGEIILVVIGILIALQINNWNQNSKERNVEQEYLVSLNEEFNYNLIELEKMIKRNGFNADNALELSNLMGPDNPSITENEFADLAPFNVKKHLVKIKIYNRNRMDSEYFNESDLKDIYKILDSK